MAWAPLLLTLLAHCTGSASQKEVIQEPTLSTTPGGTVTLTCGFRNGDVTNLASVIWIQQKPSQESLGLIGYNNKSAEGISDRFLGSLLGNKAGLIILGAQAEDEAEYSCAMYSNNQYHYDKCKWGKIPYPCISSSHFPWIDHLWDICTMAWAALSLLTLLLHCTGSLSNPSLTQPPSSSVSLGASAKLTCTLSSGYNSYIVDWYQQGPGKGPRFIMLVGPNGLVGNKGNGIPDRFSGSGSGLDRYLTIQNSQAEDEADYYCGVNDGSSY
ncbi:uncharacterized protein LOC103118561 [Erinaceus europaeus]|uniref:Uncharacterized protein LOC103118561 n=1 Tax=Erinaceus europaeus TaxID=9365 RepID=A0ABM3XIL2_ERIEU|nr:uncharacterized protein LOC103118561 [Erinaceus europaeus]